MYLKKELYELIRTDESIVDFIQDSSLDGLWYWDLEHPENEWMNARFWSVLGYNPDEMPHKSSAWQNIINQDDLKAANDNFSKHCENPNHPYDQVVRYTHKNGSTVWIRCRGLAIRDKNGKPIRMLGAHYDLTELKRSEEGLLKAKEKAEESEKKLQLINKELEIFKTIADNAVYGKAIADLKGNIIYINKFFANIHGYTPDELTGQNLSLFHNQKQMEEFGRLNESLIKNGYYAPTEVWHTNRKGTVFPMLMSGTLIEDETGNPLYLSASAVDITERKQAELLLQEKNNEITAQNEELNQANLELIAAKAKAEERFRKSIENSPVQIAIVEKDGKLSFLNKQFIQVFGYTRQEIPSMEEWFTKAYPDNEYRNFVIHDWGQEVERSIKNDVPTGYKEYLITCKNGEIKTVTLSAYFEKGTAYGVFRDITDRKQAENALLVKMAELERFHKLTVGREINMVELKKEVNNLLNKLGEGNKYKIVE